MKKITIEVHSNGYTVAVEQTYFPASSTVFLRADQNKMLGFIRELTILPDDGFIAAPCPREQIFVSGVCPSLPIT